MVEHERVVSWPLLPPQARPRVPLGAFAVSGPNFAEGRVWNASCVLSTKPAQHPR
jgi:hypothetical protein